MKRKKGQPLVAAPSINNDETTISLDESAQISVIGC